MTRYAMSEHSQASASVRRIRTHHLLEMKQRGEKWAMLTAYEQYAAQTFDEAGIPVLLVGDSASNNVYGNETSLPVTVDELLPLVRAVTRSATRSLVVADLPFGSYQASAEQAFHTAVRFMKEADAHAVKLEGGLAMVPQVELLTRSAWAATGYRAVGIPDRASSATRWRCRRPGRSRS
jgi:3-methyl-2-oxobutanoate hydroxymethyltransferase